MRKILTSIAIAAAIVPAMAQNDNSLLEKAHAEGKMIDAQFIIPTAPRSTIVVDTVYSDVLPENRAYTVLLPRNYDKHPEKKYPIVYLLHGIMDTNEGWYKNGHIKTVMDKLVESGEADEMIVVTPDAGGNIYNGVWNGYYDMPGWPYEKYFFEVFMPYIENKYRVIGDREHRAIGGLSMGGGGSTAYAQKHPELFSAVYAMSAQMDLDAGGGLPAMGQEKMTLFNQSVRDNAPTKFVENADEATKEKLRSVSWWIDCGDDDVLFDVDIDFCRAMKKAGIPYQLRVRDGGHDWEYWNTALYTALPYFSRAFKYK